MSMIGKTLGTFECTALLGKGGMGEVYKAKDQKLGRDVAIKVLPEEFAKDTDRVARFQREAKLLASLNHPNIAAIYGLEESDGTHFLVLELIEGDTLADRLKRGAIPVEESLKLALQIAEALEAAHEKGVIHRDLKPANIKVTPDGKVKVLDFGLAKAFAGDQAEVNLSHSPTLSEAATLQGVILGTAAYMSPEQAKGKTVDKRTDVWAFGCVLFEMLTGRSVFAADDVSQTLARVLERQPDFSTLPQNLHPKIFEMLDRCMEKDVKNRYSSISDARVDIQKVLADPGGVFVQPVSTEEPRAGLRQMLPWIVSALVLVAIIAGGAVWYLKPTPPPEPRPVIRFDYHLPEGQTLRSVNRQAMAVSPDGMKIVYAASGQLYLKNLSEQEARPIQGTDEDPSNPFFSPDGEWVGYFSRIDDQLKKIAIMGGAPMTICDADNPYGATWGTDDMIVFGQPDSIMRVSSSGGIPEEIVRGENGPFLCPQILPNGKSILFSSVEDEGLQVSVQSLESGDRKDLFPGGPAQYLPTGHLVYASENDLVAVPFDPDSLSVSGSRVNIVEDVLRQTPLRTTQSAISDSGTLVYMPGITLADDTFTPQFTLVWVDRQGKETPIATQPAFYSDPKISPDGTKVALTLITTVETSDIWILDLNRENLLRLTFNGNSRYPLWSRDGQRIFFVSGDENKSGIYWRKADGTGSDEPLGSVPDGTLVPESWSSNGKTLVTTKGPPQLATGLAAAMKMSQVLRGRRPATKRSTVSERTPRSKRSPMPEVWSYDIGSLLMEGDHEWKPLLYEEYWESNPRISPNGDWIAYESDESEQSGIYLRPFPDVDKGKWNVSIGDGQNPRWSPNGRELFYESFDGLMAVSVETDPILELGTPKSLFSGRYLDWDIHPDGKRFLMIKPVEAAGDDSTQEGHIPRIFNVVVNWFEELKERVPVH